MPEGRMGALSHTELRTKGGCHSSHRFHVSDNKILSLVPDLCDDTRLQAHNGRPDVINSIDNVRENVSYG